MQALHFLRLALGTIALMLISSCGGAAEPVDKAVDAKTPAPVISEHFEVSVYGDGPDVILVPGLASHHDIWLPTIEDFSETHRLHVVQVSGFAGAQSRGNTGEDDVLGALSQDLVSYAANMDQPPAIVGHSLGGLVSLKAGLADASAFDRVMVIDVLPFFSVLMDPEATADGIAATATLMTSVLLMQDEATYAERQGEALRALTKDPEMAEKSLEWSIQTDRAVMAQAMKEVLVTDLRADMNRFAVPLTVLYARDPAVPNMEATEALYLNDYAPVPTVEITPIDGALHFVMADQPEAFRDAMQQFLSAP